MTPELTQQQQSSELRFRREVANRFGVLPNSFCSPLSNLLHNAAKFMNEDGSVRICATITQPNSDVRRQVSISVIDSGIGMSPELLPRVFDSFTQGDTPDVQLDSALAWVCILFNLAVFTSCVRWRR